jgi:perosamine synthetase
VNPIPLMHPYIPPAAKAAVAGVLDTRWIGQGPKVDEFERRFTQMVGYASVAVGSCTDALHLAYILSDIGPGDEVIAPLFTCTATNIPLLYMGTKIRFADVAPGSLNVDPVAVARMVNERTKAIVVVHYGGQRVKTAGLVGFGPKVVPVIEDCAQSLGGETPLGDFACYSFQAVKHVTTGDGGMLTMLDESLLEKAKRIRWFGIDRQAKLAGKWANDITEVGYKYQMTDIGAAMGLAGLDSLEAQIGYRRSLRTAYALGLDGVDGIALLDTDPKSACWLCTVLADRRDHLRRKLTEHGIESGQVHYRNDRYSIFAGSRGEFPNMDAVDSRYLCLPLHMEMSIEDVERICAVVRSGW